MKRFGPMLEELFYFKLPNEVKLGHEYPEFKYSLTTAASLFKAGPLEAILVIFGRRALIFLV